MSSFDRIVYVLAVTSCWAFGLACGETKPPTTAAGGAPSNPAPSARSSNLNPTPKETTSDVHISDEIRSRCGISDADAYFVFNSASVTTHDRTPLDLVVRCFTSGPLKGRGVKLVGRADPRGPSDYNMTLGQWRADSVEVYLTSRGMNKSKAQTTSRGAMDAMGSDEATWQHDRRVDVLLAE